MTPATSTPHEQLLNDEFLARLSKLSIYSRRLLAGKLRGEKKSRKRGVSLDFADYRNYSQGDDLRRIDWNIYGRLEKLFLKLYHEEEDRTVYLILDTSMSMAQGGPAAHTLREKGETPGAETTTDSEAIKKFTAARRLVASLAYIGLNGGDRIVIYAGGAAKEAQLSDLRASGGKGTFRLFRFLEEISCSGKTDLNTLVRSFATEHRRRGICVLVSDFLDPAGYQAPLKTLKAGQMDVTCVQLLGADEADPALLGDMRLVDIETGETVDVTVNQALLDKYRETLKKFCSGLKEYCSRCGFGYLYITSDVPFEAMVLQYLRHTGIIR
ncbi:MAG TPA: DUF58 domain-containing protein [Planctomycetota bacterium]|nr:DUF58 domain-containing protein [Planctomycetota bacterium]